MAAELSIDGNNAKKYSFEQNSPRRLFARFFYAPEQKPGKHTARLRVTKLAEGASFYLGQFMVIGAPNSPAS